MTCNCRSEIEAQLTEMFASEAPKASDHKVELQGYGFGVINNTLTMRPFMPYKRGATFPMKSGGTKWKAERGSMLFSYCPFCGVKLSNKESS